MACTFAGNLLGSEQYHIIQLNNRSVKDRSFVSLSIGGTERTANEDTKTLYDRADKALYQAKNQKGELRLYEQTI